MFTCVSGVCRATYSYQTSLDFSCVLNYHCRRSQSWGSRLNCLPAFGPSSFSCCPRDRDSLLWMRRFIDVPQSQRLIRAKYCVRAVVASWWLQQQYTPFSPTPSLWADGSPSNWHECSFWKVKPRASIETSHSSACILHLLWKNHQLAHLTWIRDWVWGIKYVEPVWDTVFCLQANPSSIH